MVMRFLFCLASMAFIASCTTLSQKSPTPADAPPADPQIQDPLVDPEVMTDRPIESTTLEPDPPKKPAKAKKKPQQPKKKK